MNEVTLAKDGSILQAGREGIVDPLACLGCKLVLEEGYCLRSYFEMLLRYPLLTRLNGFLPSFADRYRGFLEQGTAAPGLSCLELGKTVEMIGFPGVPRLEIYTTFRGMTGDQPCEIRSFAMESLLDTPIRVGKLRHIVFGDKVDVFRFDTMLTLFEFIDGIAWELSFHVKAPQCELRR
ncbi:MAG: hypothetical protein C4576_16095 [Desulfobacteraceae bacterium]|nr:MAG: hypothetical protein C4576_16095 [Desulfobacteraceae bacterium]